MITRRTLFLTFAAAPAIVRASSLMAIRPLPPLDDWLDDDVPGLTSPYLDDYDFDWGLQNKALSSRR